MTRPVLFVVDYDPRGAVLVPRAMAVLGLIGGPLLFASGIAVLFGLYEQVSEWSGIATLRIFAWKVPLGIWLIVKGFNQSVIASEKFSFGASYPANYLSLGREGDAPCPW